MTAPAPQCQPITCDAELLQQKLEFAEFEWNRATDGMKERDVTIASLKGRVDDLETTLRKIKAAYLVNGSHPGRRYLALKLIGEIADAALNSKGAA